MKVTFGTQGFDAGHQSKRCHPGPLVSDQDGGAGDDEGGDWIGLADLVVSVIGFSVVIRELIRIAHASETGQASYQVNLKEADPLAGARRPEVR